MSPSDVVYGARTGVLPATEAAAIETSSPQSGVSWAAVIAGGVTAAAISTMLVIFGAGLGLASISPWSGQGVSPTTFTVLAAIWLIIVQWVSSAFGGYIAGRLRTKWVAVHTDEVFFRDTAHGFLAWALGTLIVVAVVTGGAGSAANNAGHAAAAMAQNSSVSNNYYVDLLFRQNANPAAPAAADGSAPAPVTPGISQPGITPQDMQNQASVILAEGVTNGGVSSTDQAYLAQLVSESTGLAPADAQARLTDVLNREQADITKAKQVADASRKAASGAAIYTFVSLLIGAFIASVSGAIGGRLRDNY
jgi:hypothetical protein